MWTEETRLKNIKNDHNPFHNIYKFKFFYIVLVCFALFWMFVYNKQDNKKELNWILGIFVCRIKKKL